MLETPRPSSGPLVGIVRRQMICGAPESFFFGPAKLPMRKPVSNPGRCQVGERSSSLRMEQ